MNYVISKLKEARVSYYIINRKLDIKKRINLLGDILVIIHLNLVVLYIVAMYSS